MITKSIPIKQYLLSVKYILMNMERIADETDEEKRQTMMDMMIKELVREEQSIKDAMNTERKRDGYQNEKFIRNSEAV